MAGMVMVMVMVLLGRPEFAAGIGGAGSTHPPPTRHERKGDQSSSLGTGSDEASRTSSATHKRRGGTKDSHQKGSPQNPLLGKMMMCRVITIISSLEKEDTWKYDQPWLLHTLLIQEVSWRASGPVTEKSCGEEAQIEDTRLMRFWASLTQQK